MKHFNSFSSSMVWLLHINTFLYLICIMENISCFYWTTKQKTNPKIQICAAPTSLFKAHFELEEVLQNQGILQVWQPHLSPCSWHGEQTGIHKGGHKPCPSTSPVWVHRRKARQKFLQTHWGGECSACCLGLGEQVRNRQSKRTSRHFFFWSNTPVFDGWCHNLLPKTSFSSLQWAFHDSKSKITAQETFSFLS